MHTKTLNLIDDISDLQMKLTEEWHKDIAINTSQNRLLECVTQNHLRNYKLWHVEDAARKRDVEPTIIADCKYKIDSLNQQRNDFIEEMDDAFIQVLSDQIPSNVSDLQNTETLGMATDRLSILALKIYHMKEQTLRTDIDKKHLNESAARLNVLIEQRKNLMKAIKVLISEYLSGAKQINRYYQFKMYNDPTRNPELYENQ